jgi:sensor histidine kinase YesM
VLTQRDRVIVPLEDELRFARTYLEIAQFRFPDRLSFSIDVPDELRSSPVPLFILQPLVENAITHGVGKRVKGGHIQLTATRHDHGIQLEVRDDCGPLSWPLREGIGMSNTRERLRASFGNRFAMSLESHGADTVARIVLPLGRAPGSEGRS